MKILKSGLDITGELITTAATKIQENPEHTSIEAAITFLDQIIVTGGLAKIRIASHLSDELANEIISYGALCYALGSVIKENALEVVNEREDITKTATVSSTDSDKGTN